MLTQLNKINKINSIKIYQNSNTLVINNIVRNYSTDKQKRKRKDGDDEEGNDPISKYDIKVSKASYQKIIQRFTDAFRRPDKINTKRSPEETELRRFLYEYGKYSLEIIKRRDQEEVEKLEYQFDAIMELPAELRKTALLVETRDEQPDLIPFLYDTPPTKTNPKDKIVYKKKDTETPLSQKLFLSNAN